MKRVLVIANLHHASPRIPALLAFLGKYGWRATVITPPIGVNAQLLLGLPKDFFSYVDIAPAPYCGDVFEMLRKLLSLFGFSSKTSYTEQLKNKVGKSRRSKSFIDRLLIAYQTVVAIPDTEWTWYRSAIKVASSKIDSQKFDIILSSSPVSTVHFIAAELKKKYNLPWVADMRDLWSQNHNYSFPEIRRKLDRYLEIKTLKSADLITTISHPLSDKLKKLHKNQTTVIPNGYQPLFNKFEFLGLPPCFTISYTGTIYSGKQDPSLLLQALKNLIDKKKIDIHRVEVNFYGRFDSLLQQLILDLGIEDIVHQRGFLPRDEIRQVQRQSHLLLLMQWEDAAEEGIFPLKLFEYLDSGRPIIVTGRIVSSEVLDIICKTATGSVLTTVEAVEDVVINAYQVFLAGNPPHYNPNKLEVSKYSYSECAASLSDCFDLIIGQTKL